MLINKKNPHGGDVYSNKIEMDYSANINPFGMPEEITEAAFRAVSDCANYPDPYCTALRNKLSASEGVPFENILCGNGSAELIYSFAFTLPKDRPALIIAPAFQEYADSLAAAGIEADYYILSADNGFRLTDEFLKKDLSGYSAVYLCSPANPTGALTAPEIVQQIAASGVRMMLDLSFLDLTEDPKVYDIPLLCSQYPNVAVLRSFTKNFALAGLRLGYVLSSDADFLEEMSEKAQCWNVSTPAQAAGCAALDNMEWLAECVRRLTAERERVSAELTALGIQVFPGAANFLLLYSDINLCEKLLERGIMIRDCSNYIGLGKGFVRIAIRTKEENDRLLAAVREVLK